MFKKKAEYTNEEVNNIFVFKCAIFTFLGMVCISFLNLIGVFGTNVRITQYAFLLVAILMLIAVIVIWINKFDKKWIKYFLIGIIELMTLTIGTSLTYHATIILFFPIVYSCVFMEKKVSIYTYIWSIIVLFCVTYLGYLFGVADLNYIFLPTNSITSTVAGNGTVNGTDFMIEFDAWKLFLYFVFPRIIVISMFFPVCTNITKIISSFSAKAQNMESIATHDGMTDLYNKRMYDELVESYYSKQEKLGIIYFDVNDLKYVNDHYGHEAGDYLIGCIAKSIKFMETKRIKGFRIGGDEFLLIVENPNLNEMDELVVKFKEFIVGLKDDNSVPVSAAVGYSIGSGSKFDDVLSAAEEKMYENKKICHDVVSK